MRRMEAAENYSDNKSRLCVPSKELLISLPQQSAVLLKLNLGFLEISIQI